MRRELSTRRKKFYYRRLNQSVCRSLAMSSSAYLLTYSSWRRRCYITWHRT